MEYIVKIENLETYKEKLDQARKLIEELQNLKLEIKFEPNEINNLAYCADKIKTSD